MSVFYCKYQSLLCLLILIEKINPQHQCHRYSNINKTWFCFLVINVRHSVFSDLSCGVWVSVLQVGEVCWPVIKTTQWRGCPVAQCRWLEREAAVRAEELPLSQSAQGAESLPRVHALTRQEGAVPLKTREGNGGEQSQTAAVEREGERERERQQQFYLWWVNICCLGALLSLIWWVMGILGNSRVSWGRMKWNWKTGWWSHVCVCVCWKSGNEGKKLENKPAPDPVS